MKAKFYLLAAGGAVMLTLAAGSAFAFHGGAVAHCDGCHSMHNSADNPVGFDRNGDATGAVANGQLLKGSDASSTCLNCHKRNGGYGVLSTDGSNKNTGGDFFFQSNGWTENVHGHLTVFQGDQAGHNVVASDYGLMADSNPNNLQAPGGDYSATLLGCTSCHDAHGQVMGGTKAGIVVSGSGSYGAPAPTDGSVLGNYRLLGDTKYTAGDSQSDGYAFTQPAPVARADGSGGSKVRYGSGMSQWCSNCHSGYGSGNDGTKHVSNWVLGGLAANYNSYVATGDFKGSQATAWDPLVPFETGTTDSTTLDVNSTTGPANGAAKVMCLTCHRAHGSAHNNAGRWDFQAEFLYESKALEAKGTNVPATALVYYGDGSEIDIVAKYGMSQRSLCNKCHVQD